MTDSILDSAIQDMVQDLEKVRTRIERHVSRKLWKKPGPKQFAQIEAKLNKDGQTGRVEKKGKFVATFSLGIDKEKKIVTFDVYLIEQEQ